MNRALFRKLGLTLAPASRDARELLAALQEGATIFIEVWQPRNMKQHRKFFKLLNNVVEATGRWTSTEHLRRDLLIATHRYDEEVNRLTGEVRQVPHSMKVASMPRAEFEALYDDAMRVLTEALGCDPEMLLEEPA